MMQTRKPRLHGGLRVHRMRGFTLIEALIAALILSLSVLALVSMWYFTFNMTVKSDRVGAAYTVGQHAMERVKLAGFDYATEGDTVLYYDNLGGNESAAQTSQHRMRAVTHISSDAGYPSYGAKRTVVITVTLLGTGETLYKTGTNLVKRGI